MEVWHLDLNSYETIQEFASRASSELDHLDVVVLNAGVYMLKYEKSPYGWEETLQVNVLSTALLGLLLLPVLKKTAEAASTPGRRFPVLEIVSSGFHQRVVMEEDRRNTDSIYTPITQPRASTPTGNTIYRNSLSCM